MKRYNLLFKHEASDPLLTSETALEAINRVKSYNVGNVTFFTFLSIRLLPQHVMQAMDGMSMIVKEFMVTRLDTRTFERVYQRLDDRLIYAALITLAEPVHPNVILTLMDSINGPAREKLYYAALDRYLMKHQMSEVQFLRRYDPQGARLRMILSMYPTGDVTFDRGDIYRTTHSIGGDPLDTVHDDQLYVDDSGYAYSTSDIFNMVRTRMRENPYTREKYRRRDLDAHLNSRVTRGIPIIASGAARFHEVPFFYEHTKMWSKGQESAIRYGHDMRWFISLYNMLLTTLSIILGGYMYMAADRSGYKYRMMDHYEVISDAAEFTESAIIYRNIMRGVVDEARTAYEASNI